MPPAACLRQTLSADSDAVEARLTLFLEGDGYDPSDQLERRRIALNEDQIPVGCGRGIAKRSRSDFRDPRASTMTDEPRPIRALGAARDSYAGTAPCRCPLCEALLRLAESAVRNRRQRFSRRAALRVASRQ
jgi:hypothetical protein